MRLSQFIEANIKEILEEWDQFALTLFPSGAHVSASVLRDHARGILMELTEDMETAQSAQQQADKSKGEESKLARRIAPPLRMESSVITADSR